ncbi:uncharacterized protein LOC131658332 [Vicia villosa]|uniref:uncharacterized protein LOC131658332 n=1 Tax=Vicia villosa TaxID=3911 RepID=UPI00273AAF42|nr:uncharacterized protein LOC131658332 [Vicia villosa]
MEVISSFKGEWYLGIKVKRKNKIYYVVNIYAPYDLCKKRILWRKLVELKEEFDDGEWIIGGDFNSIKVRNERRGRVVAANYNEMNLFVSFIEESRLVDIPCKEKKFTWYSGDEMSMSRIDRFLISDDVINDWGWWDKVEGRGDFVLKEKLHLLKERLKWWNKVVFGIIDLEVEEGVKDIIFGDKLLELDSVELNPEIVKKRKEATNRFWTDLRIKENMLVQKSRLKWLNKEDSNSGFFHKVMKDRRRRNHIGPINSLNGSLSSVKDVKEEIVHHFLASLEE